VQLPVPSIPIYLIGAGGIVNDAHLPAYAIAGFTVSGIYDTDTDKAKATAARFHIPQVFESLGELISCLPSQYIIDLAVPGSAIIPVLEQLPDRSPVLVQKPMGEDLAAAKEILAISRKKQLMAAVNFQLRYAPFITALRKLIEEGKLGDIYDVEINLSVYMPWHLWSFLYTSPRVEILYHSIHYIDLIRSFLGNPQAIQARTIKHSAMQELASVRSTIIMDYGEMIRATILTNHTHVYGAEQAYIKIEGSKGAAILGIGVVKNYPTGEADTLRYTTKENGHYSPWVDIPVEGNWFPHAFIGSMIQVLQAAGGIIAQPDNSVEDCIHTMACVEAAYESSRIGGIDPLSL